MKPPWFFHGEDLKLASQQMPLCWNYLAWMCHFEDLEGGKSSKDPETKPTETTIRNVVVSIHAKKTTITVYMKLDVVSLLHIVIMHYHAWSLLQKCLFLLCSCWLSGSLCSSKQNQRNSALPRHEDLLIWLMLLGGYNIFSTFIVLKTYWFLLVPP